MSWDPILHGTIFFGALLPLTISLGMGLLGRPLAGVILAVASTSFILFGMPSPPWTSDDYAVVWIGALIAISLVTSRFDQRGRWWDFLVGTVVFSVLAWVFYPAWLASDGGLLKKLMLSVLVGASVPAFRLACSGLCGGAGPLHPVLPSALLPAAVGTSVLLVLGGSIQFGQAAGAVASGLGGLCLAMLIRPQGVSSAAITRIAGFCGGFLLVLAWGGWLFAEIEPLSAVLVLASPAPALFAGKVDPSAGRVFWRLFRDSAFAGLLAAPVLIWVGWHYLQALSASEGY